MTDQTVRDWLPILTHPEHGAAICEAAGCDIDTDNDGKASVWFPGYGGNSGSLRRWQTAALCYGVQVVMAKQTRFAVLEYLAEFGWFAAYDRGSWTPPQPTPYTTGLTAAREWLEVTP